MEKHNRIFTKKKYAYVTEHSGNFYVNFYYSQHALRPRIDQRIIYVRLIYMKKYISRRPYIVRLVSTIKQHH